MLVQFAGVYLIIDNKRFDHKLIIIVEYDMHFENSEVKSTIPCDTPSSRTEIYYNFNDNLFIKNNYNSVHYFLL